MFFDQSTNQIVNGRLQKMMPWVATLEVEMQQIISPSF